MMAKFSEFKFYEDRLKTFIYWPEQLIPNKQSLSKAGFYYTGIGDKVTCFCCGVTLHQWKTTDQPWEEHMKYSEQCDYIKMTGKVTKSELHSPSTSLFTFGSVNSNKFANSPFGDIWG